MPATYALAGYRKHTAGPSTATLSNHTIAGTSTLEANPSPPPVNIRGPGWATYFLNNTGLAEWEASNDDGSGTGTNVVTSGTYSGEYVTTGVANDFEVQVVLTGAALFAGSAPTGSGTWTDLGTSRFWMHKKTTAGSASSSLAITIRRKSDTVTVATCTITLNMN